MASFSRTSNKAPKKAPTVVKRPKKPSHKELIAKWAKQGGKYVEKKQWTKGDIINHRNKAENATKKQKEQENAAAALIESQTTAEPTTIPTKHKTSDLAKQRLQNLAEGLYSTKLSAQAGEVGEAGSLADTPVEELQQLAESRQTQLDELETLEAIFPEEFKLLGCDSSLDDLRNTLEELLANVSSDPDALRSALAPLLEFTLQLSAEADDDQEEDHQGLIAFVLLSVAFPPLYPDPTAPPRLQLVDVMVVKAQHEQAPTEALSSLKVLAEVELIKALVEQAQSIQPDPCVYDLVTWLGENVFRFVRDVQTTVQNEIEGVLI